MIVGATLSPGRLAARQLAFQAALLIMIAAAVLGVVTIRAFDAAIEPELSNRSRLIGSDVRGDIQQALDLGMPLNQLRGTEKYLSSVLASFPEIARVAIRSTDGSIVSVAARTPGGIDTYDVTHDPGVPAPTATFGDDAFTFPILTRNTVVGDIVVEVDSAFVDRQFRDIFLDVLVVILVAVLVAFEIMLAVVGASMSKPLDRLQLLLERQARGDFSARLMRSVNTSLDRVAARFSDHSEDLNARFSRLVAGEDGAAALPSPRGTVRDIGRTFGLSGQRPSPIRLTDVVDMRLALFVFVVATELSGSFLPLYIRAAVTSSPWLSEAVLISLPLIAYLVSLVLLSPVAGIATERYPPRLLFLAALVPAVVSNIGLSLSETVTEIVVWRSMVGAAYAVASIACQDYALGAGGSGQRARAIGGFIAVITGGTFCGIAVGGVLADRIGQSNVFLVSALLTVAAGAMALAMLSGERVAAARQSTHDRRSHSIWSALRNARFMALLIGIAIPANIFVFAFLFYLVPLMLADVGSTPADIGRALMLYYLIIVLLAPRMGGLMERSIAPNVLVAVGGIVSGLALVILAYWHGYWAVTAAVAIAGLGHTMIRGPQVEVAMRIAEAGGGATSPAATLGALRTFERTGSIVGLLAAAALASRLGYVETAALTGCLAIAGALVFAIAGALGRSRRRIAQ
ncbi:MAG: MFS transporter [Gammaproteobacteria bacterium]|nr:MFS transporter [Gammaproteobacteria bacterium]